MRFTICDLRFAIFRSLVVALVFIGSFKARGETILFTEAIVHTASSGTITNSVVLVESNKITGVFSVTNGEAIRLKLPGDANIIPLHGQHLYPGLIELDSALGLTEIDAVRATQDSDEVGEGFMPDVESWVAVNPDSELLPVSRANGIAYFEPVPQGRGFSGKSGLLAVDGWTWEQMLVKKPAALHLFWPELGLDTTLKERLADKSKAKSLEDQDKERKKKIRELQDLIDEARAYAKAKDASTNKSLPAPEKNPSWEAMLPCIHGEIPIVIHADEVRQIKSAANWAATNHLRALIAGGRDAWMCAELLATNKTPVIYEHVFTQPSRDTESYDVHFTAPEKMRAAGVTVLFSTGAGGFGAMNARNLPYHAAQAIAFGLPEDEALKAVTLYPAQILGVADRIGSIEVGKDATLFICDGKIFDLRANVKRMWIAGHEISLENRHTRLYEKYRNRPRLR
jgi:imidazolonepropionase-like amidohydrolase